MRRRRPWHRVVEDKKVREKEILREDDCLSWSCKLLSYLILFLVWPIFLIIFTYSNVFIRQFAKREMQTTPLVSTLTECMEKCYFHLPPKLPCVLLVATYDSEPENLWFYMLVRAAALPPDMVAGCPSPAVDHFHRERGKTDAFKPSFPFKRSFNEGGRGCQACIWVIVPSTTTSSGINHCPTLN